MPGESRAEGQRSKRARHLSPGRSSSPPAHLQAAPPAPVPRVLDFSAGGESEAASHDRELDARESESLVAPAAANAADNAPVASAALLRANRMPHNTPLDWEVVPPMSLRPQTEKEMSDDEDANHDDGVHCKFCLSCQDLPTGNGGLNEYPKDGCLAVQYAEQYFMDVKRTNWYPGFMGTTNNLVRKEHYRTFVKLFMDARGKGNRVKVPKCFSRLIRQLWSSDSYVDHQDE